MQSSRRNAHGLLQSIQLAAKLVRRSGPTLAFTACALSLGTGLLVAVELIAIRSIVNDLIAGEKATSLLILFGSATAVRRLLASVGSELQWMVAERVGRSAVNDVLRVATAATYEDFETAEFQNSLSRALKAGQQDVWGAAWGLLKLLTASFTVVGLLGVLVAVAPGLIIPFGVAALVLAIGSVVKSRLVYDLDFYDTEPDRERQYLSEALVSRSEGKEVRLFGTRQQLLERHDDLMGRRLGELGGVIKRRLAADAFGNVVLATVVVGCLIVIAQRTGNSLEFGDAAVAAVTAHQLAGTLSGLFAGMSQVAESSQRVGDLESFTRREISTESHLASETVNAIALHDVSYRYPGADRAAVSGIDMRIRKGELVALVGENGSGKSTVAKLLTGLYAPTAGQVVVETADGVTAVQGPLVGVVGAVFQDYAKYELSVSDNVVLSRSDPAIETERISKSLAAAGLTQVVRQLSRGLNTRLGRRFAEGADLSIGQWQRLALARALYAGTPFVTLDEPSASLDPKVEAELFDELRTLMPEQGLLLISHRFASVRSADRIVVMNEGQVVEQGTHLELMRAEGLYARLFNLQAKRFGIGEEPVIAAR